MKQSKLEHAREPSSQGAWARGPCIRVSSEAWKILDTRYSSRPGGRDRAASEPAASLALMHDLLALTVPQLVGQAPKLLFKMARKNPSYFCSARLDSRGLQVLLQSYRVCVCDESCLDEVRFCVMFVNSEGKLSCFRLAMRARIKRQIESRARPANCFLKILSSPCFDFAQGPSLSITAIVSLSSAGGWGRLNWTMV